ncbi:hypothetical protein [Nitrosomonas sp. Is37]|uniref:hypothetical protein n=1 Tax=Nitrosomonas sp. Is37 TaxID=3080535 RepID=UPI00294B1CD0|nr:hypothetical protein [Nitrosomonas sp. Is37]MDV6344069.1 hypothetical protein [Nitrosomonas sp. Is37]
MQTSELLQAIKGEFPDLTPKTLRDWVKEGFLTTPTRVGLGFKDGVNNEWAPDSVDRIRIMKSVTTKRIDKVRARRALLASGFFIGVAGLRVELLDVIDSIHNTHNNPKRFVKDSQFIASRKPSVLFNENVRNLIQTCLVSPRPVFDKYFELLSKHIAVSEQPRSPLQDLLELFSIYQFERDLAAASDDTLQSAFEDSASVFDAVSPILGGLCSINGYSPINKNRTIAEFINFNVSPNLKIDRHEFDFIVRLLCVAGCLTVVTHRARIIELLPKVLVYVGAHMGIEQTTQSKTDSIEFTQALFNHE